MKMISQTKAAVRDVIQRVVPSRIPPIIVASMGRSGSTLVHNSICQGLGKARFGLSNTLTSRLVAGYAWDLSEARLKPGVAYKTHALAHEMPVLPDAKVVFLFGSAVDAAVSVLSTEALYGTDWVQEHFGHLRAQGKFADLTSRDVLRFTDQLDGWFGLSGNPIIALHYDALWDNQDRLSDFLGFEVTLPIRRQRRSKSIAPAVLDELNVTYADLETRIAALPGVTAWIQV